MAAGSRIGEPAIVAEAVRTANGTQFRTMDHALVPLGAPLMQYLDYVAFRDIGPISRLTLAASRIASWHIPTVPSDGV